MRASAEEAVVGKAAVFNLASPEVKVAADAVTINGLWQNEEWGSCRCSHCLAGRAAGGLALWKPGYTAFIRLWHYMQRTGKDSNLYFPLQHKVFDINRPYFSKPRKYRRLFFPSLHIDRGAAEVNMAREIIKPVFSRLREIRVLSQEDLLAHHWLVLLPEKCETKASSLCVASATMQAQVARRRPVRNGLIDFFPPAFVNSQIAQVDRPKILERMVFGSSPLLSGVFVTFFSFKLRT